MSSANPWSALSLPYNQQLHARRVNADFSWNFFWAIDSAKQPLLLLQFAPDVALATNQLPLLDGMNLEHIASADDSKLLFRLLDTAHIDIFHQLCLDIIAATQSAATEEAAVHLAIARTWRWHHLLRGGSNRKLTENQQKGLIGELLVLEKHLLPNFDPTTAVSCWVGPLGTPKDFEVGDVCVEVKARRGAATPFVKISSEAQLDNSSVGRLFLYVVNLTASVQPGAGELSVTDIAARIRQHLDEVDIAAADGFDAKLSAAGFRWEDDYSDSKWLLGDQVFYDVTRSFPRITPATAGPGVSGVSYSLSLQACTGYLIDHETVLQTFRGA